MITRIEIDGFKSLRGFSLDLEPLTAVVGANGVGKSNLFDALLLLSRMGAGVKLTDAFKEGRGRILDQFARGAEDAATRMSFAVEALLPTRVADESGNIAELGHTRVRYEIEIERVVLAPSGHEMLMIVRERLAPIQPERDDWMARHPELRPFARYLAPVGSYFLQADERSSSHVSGEKVLTTTTSGRWHESQLRLAASSGRESPQLFAFALELRGFRALHLEPSKLRLPSQRADGATLAADGSNLPTALATLPPERRARIRADLADLVPGFRSFDVVLVEDEFRIDAEFTDGRRMPARVLSDGTLRLLALMTLLRGSRPGTLIAIEEPENGIYPGSVRALVEKLVALTVVGDDLAPQVLLNSHSPAVVAALHHRPDALVFADMVRRGGQLHATRMRHVRRAEDPEDRGARTVSVREIERILDTTRPAEPPEAEP